MVLLVLTVLLALWALGAVAAVSLCMAAGRADRDELASARGLVPLRLVSR